MPITNIARGNSTPTSGKVTGPDRFQRIVVNEIIAAIEATAPNSSVDWEVLFGVLGSAPTPVVKMSMSIWMR